MNLRPCTILKFIVEPEISGALFHKWVDVSRIETESAPFLGNLHISIKTDKIITRTMGLIEYPDGCCRLVDVDRIQFTDK